MEKKGFLRVFTDSLGITMGDEEYEDDFNEIEENNPYAPKKTKNIEISDNKEIEIEKEEEVTTEKKVETEAEKIKKFENKTEKKVESKLNVPLFDGAASKQSTSTAVQQQAKRPQYSQYQTQLKPAQSTNNDENYQTIFINPRSFSECREIADYIKNDKVVTLNLEHVNHKEAQRIIDFLSGAITIKEAKWVPISTNVFTSVPKNIKFLYSGHKEFKQSSFVTLDQD